MASPKLLWDSGTAYDMFVSLNVIHEPAIFGLRSAWAAGMRARLPVKNRETLEQSQLLFKVPFHWINTLPDPKDSFTVLYILRQIPPGERLHVLAIDPDKSSEVVETLKGLAKRGKWNEKEQKFLKAAYAEECDKKKKSHLSTKELLNILGLWANVEEFGERYLEALRTYQEVFFATEEKRISPALQGALSNAQKLSEQLELPDLLEELSQGLRFTELPKAAEFVLAPSYWCTPLMYYGKASVKRWIFLFGAKPEDESLIPGEDVPDALLRALKALSDPTRLSILHYLIEKPLTQSQLSRRLCLRVPTVIHHLKILRLAGLVKLTLGIEEGGKVKRYAARSDAVAAAFTSLKGFLEEGKIKNADSNFK